jgi:hypothetical protein
LRSQGSGVAIVLQQYRSACGDAMSSLWAVRHIA